MTGLAFIGLDFVTKLGIGSALGVLTTVLIANSLLPAALALLGHRIDRLKVPFLRQVDDSEAARERTLVARWGRFVTGHARIVFPLVVVLTVGLASTSLLVRLGAADQGTQPTAQTSRRAYDLLAEGFGPGFNGPIPIVVDVNGDGRAPQKIYDPVQGLPGVASVAEPQLNDEKTVGIVFVTPDSAPQDEETDAVVDRPAGRRRAGGDRRGAMRSPTSPARPRRSRTSPTRAGGGGRGARAGLNRSGRARRRPQRLGDGTADLVGVQRVGHHRPRRARARPRPRRRRAPARTSCPAPTSCGTSCVPIGAGDEDLMPSDVARRRRRDARL